MERSNKTEDCMEKLNSAEKDEFYIARIKEFSDRIEAVNKEKGKFIREYIEIKKPFNEGDAIECGNEKGVIVDFYMPSESAAYIACNWRRINRNGSLSKRITHLSASRLAKATLTEWRNPKRK